MKEELLRQAGAGMLPIELDGSVHLGIRHRLSVSHSLESNTICFEVLLCSFDGAYHVVHILSGWRLLNLGTALRAMLRFLRLLARLLLACAAFGAR